MDIFAEILVSRKFTNQDKKKIKMYFASIIFSSVVLVLVVPMVALTKGIAYISTVSMLLFAAIVFVIWRELKAMQLEFEYIIVNNNIDFDKIVAKKKRTRLVSADLKLVEEIGVYNPSRFVNSNFGAEFHTERDVNSGANYYMIFPHNEYKRTLVVFTPDDKMFEALSKTLPRQLLKELPKN